MSNLEWKNMVEIVYCGKYFTLSLLDISHYLFLIPQLAFDGLRRSEGRQSVTSWVTFPTQLIYEWNIIKIHEWKLTFKIV